MPPSAATQQDTRLIADADLCVKCGLCLPHCPTYRDSGHEGDSPRGRIALIQGLVTALVPQTRVLEAHLDGCLSCRRCEVVCPAKVPYSRLLDAGRARLAETRPARTRLTRLLALALVNPRGRGLLRGLVAAYRGSGLQAFVRRFALLGRGGLARLESLLPAAQRLHPLLHAQQPAQASGANHAADAQSDAALPALALFQGCATDLFEREAVQASAQLLRAAGYTVQAADGQGCCGALHQHGGMAAEARRLARNNVAAFAGAEGIASCTSGCAATLRDYRELGVEGGGALAPRVQEYSDWLLPRIERLQFHPLPLRAALHLPCTASNVMRSDAALRALLARVPQLEVIDLDPAQHCCGAAGSHFITQPQAADRLLAPKLDAIHRLAPDLVLSANIGCSLHLGAGLTRWAGPATAGAARPAPWPRPSVLHPAVLLARQLRASRA